jgi:O-antigen ligase
VVGETRGYRLRVSRLDVAEHAAVALALAWWMFPLAHGTGGRDAGLLTWAVLTTMPALALTRSWRRPVAAVLAAIVGSAALAVCVFAPTGWYGAADAASYVYAGTLFLVALGYARTPARRTALAVAIAIAGIEQFRAALTPWMGSGDSAHPMVGTFYWHNPYAAYLVAPALIGISLAVTAGNRVVRAIGWVAAPVAVAGVVFSSSRATLVSLVVGLVIVAVAALRSGSRALVRYAAVAGACVALTLVLCGPPIFDHWRSPFSGAAARAASGESVSTNGGYRTEFWREATSVTADHPLVGGGYRSLVGASSFTNPPAWARSPQAHNGYLQASSDGGLLLGIPFVLACALVGITALGVFRRRRLRLDSETGIATAAAVATLALLAHSAVDLDWSYPATLAMTAIVAALAVAARPAREDRTPRTTVVAGRLAAVVVGVALLVSAAGAHAWGAAERVSHNGVAPPGITDAELMRRANDTFGSYRPAEAVLRRASQGRPVQPDVLRAAWRRTAAAAEVSPALALLRARALVLLGDQAAALTATLALLDRLGPTRVESIARDAAVTLAVAGQPERAKALLGPHLVSDLYATDADTAWADVEAADRAGLLADPVTRACVLAAATALGPKPDQVAPAPAPPASGCSDRIAVLGQ